MAAMAEMRVTLDPETRAAIEALTDQVKALRDLLETKAGTEVHYHSHYSQGAWPAYQPYRVTYSGGNIVSALRADWPASGPAS